jgi:hypothetical protein
MGQEALTGQCAESTGKRRQFSRPVQADGSDVRQCKVTRNQNYSKCKS